jgi:hypothetical protein
MASLVRAACGSCPRAARVLEPEGSTHPVAAPSGPAARIAVTGFVDARLANQRHRVEYPAIREQGGVGAPPRHPELSALFAEHRDEYQRLVDGVRRGLPGLRTVTSVVDDPECGFWDNEFFGNLDGIALYTLISSRRPSQYVEVGSEFSTRLARRAIDDSAASTKFLSIDPEPRADIDRLCDEMHRVSLQEVSRDVFDALRAGDILVVDATHMAHMNSDVVVLFTEVFPRRAPGVLIGMDDVFLPWDYPAEWTSRWYSEQYLLAVLLLSRDPTWRVVFPTWWVTNEPGFASTLENIASAITTRKGMQGKVCWMERARRS